jgi:ubiquinone/menaquinone biosynthesis C-methylase UbiE
MMVKTSEEPLGPPTTGKLNHRVRRYWDREPCGTGPAITQQIQPRSSRWFEQVDSHRYSIEPHIPAFAEFGRFKGARVLEIGVGAGADHLQWAKAGAECHGVDLSPISLETTRIHLDLHGYTSQLQCLDAENLTYPDDWFDVVYSWGVIHHAEHPSRIVEEVWRVLKPGGQFTGMMYGRYSLVVFKLWVRYALLKLKPWRSLSDVVWNHMESIGTKAYTPSELLGMFNRFRKVTITPILTAYDQKWIPKPFHRLLPKSAAWNLAIRAVK